MTRRSFTLEQDKKIADLYNSGLSSIKLARQFEVDKSTILQALKRQGVISRDNRGVTNEQELELCNLYKSGLTMTNISKKTGLSFQVIKAALTRHKIKGTDDRYTFTPEQEKKIIEFYQASQTMVEIAQRYGATTKTIRGVLERNSIPIRDQKLFNDEKESEIVTLYLNGLTPQKIANSLQVSRKAILNILDRQHIKKRSQRIHFFNEQAFDTLDSELPLYWIAFLYADSNVNENELRVGLSAKDISHLEKLRKFMKAEDTTIQVKKGRVYQGYKSHDSCHISFASRYLTTRLSSLGIVARRENFYKIQSSIPDHLAHHFIRGYLDGDGCISTNQQVIFLGQQDILKWIRDTLHKQAGTNLDNKIRQRKGICEISWGGKLQIKKIIDYLYKDATIYLERKKQIAQNWK